MWAVGLNVVRGGPVAAAAERLSRGGAWRVVGGVRSRDGAIGMARGKSVVLTGAAACVDACVTPLTDYGAGRPKLPA